MEEHRNIFLVAAIIIGAVLVVVGLFFWTDALRWVNQLDVSDSSSLVAAPARISPSPTPLVFITPSPTVRAVTPSPTQPKLTPTVTPAAMTVKVFFSQQDQSNISCTELTGSDRAVPQSPAVARAALEQLLRGPSEEEKAAGLFTSIPAGVVIQSLVIQNGVARTDFNEALEQGVGGSCRVAAIRAQITQTLQQFPTINSVVISINGRTEDILQP